MEAIAGVPIILWWILGSIITYLGWGYGTEYIALKVFSWVVRIAFALVALSSWIVEAVMHRLVLIPTAWTVAKFVDPKVYIDDFKGFASNEIVVTGWKLLSSVSNFFFIITLLFIGIGTLFRIDRYDYKKLLIKLVVVALLANFSLVFSGVILDFCHVIMFSFFKNGDDLAKQILEIPKALEKNVYSAENLFLILNAKDLGVEGSGPSQLLSESVTMTALWVGVALTVMVIAIVCVALVFFFISRVIMLWLLLILSPLGYVGLILPDTQGLAQKWWSNFLKHAFSGPILVFLLWIALKMMQFFLQGLHAMSANAEKVLNYGNVEKGINSAGVYLLMYIIFIIVLFLLILFTAQKLGSLGAGFAIGLAKAAMIGVGALAAGGAVKLGLRFARSRFAGRRESAEDSREKTAADLARMNAENKEAEMAGLEQVHSQQALDSHQAKIDRLGKSRDRWMLAENSARFVASLGPIAMARTAWTNYKASSTVSQKEEAEQLSGIANSVWDMATGRISMRKDAAESRMKAERINARLKAANEIEIAEGSVKTLSGDLKTIDQEKASLQAQADALDPEINSEWSKLFVAQSHLREAEMKKNIGDPNANVEYWKSEYESHKAKHDGLTAQRAKIDKDLEAINTRKQDLTNDIAQKRESVEGLQAKLKPFDDQKGKAGELSAVHDNDFIKAARKNAGFFGFDFQKSFWHDGHADAELKQALEQIEHERDPDRLIEMFSSASTAMKKAILLRLQSTADTDGLCNKMGYASDQLHKLVKDYFPHREATLLAGRLHQIALAGNNFNVADIAGYSKKTGRTEVYDDLQRTAKQLGRLKKKEMRDLIPKLSKENVRAQNADGTTQALRYASSLYKLFGSEAGLTQANRVRPEIFEELDRSLNHMKRKAKGWDLGAEHDEAVKNLSNFLEAAGYAKINTYSQDPLAQHFRTKDKDGRSRQKSQGDDDDHGS